MSTNHLPLEPPLAWPWQLPVETGMFFTQHHYHPHQRPPPPPPTQLPLEGMNCEREHLFEKPLTPSDVGKLNRLVIPKQHAERYFPLDGDSGEKGLLLSFEDEAGKAWRFRYSYWTSSQSYVLTKGWSRFVKEKRLDAGDVVLFERRRSGSERLYIGWKRRFAHDDGAAAPAANAATGVQLNPAYDYAAKPPPFPLNPSDPYSYHNHDSGEQDAGLQGQKPTRASPAVGTHSKRLRLFGVNLDCGPQQESPEPHRSGSGGGTCTEAGDHRRLQFTPGGGPFY